MEKIIFDCDNTMGMKDHPLDDGLALIQLMGMDQVDILGITTTFGNSSVDQVYENTRRLVEDLKQDIPVYRGGSLGRRESEAGQFLVDMANLHEGELSVIAVGSMANIYEAYLRDPDFFDKLKELILMGGVEGPLMIKGRLMEELNFSCDREASYQVLSRGKNISIMTGHIGLNVGFDRRDYERLEEDARPIYAYISDQAQSWSAFVNENHRREEFYIWDILASVYLSHRELFDRNIRPIKSSREDLAKGYLREAPGGNLINIPSRILDMEAFRSIVYGAWGNISL